MSRLAQTVRGKLQQVALRLVLRRIQRRPRAVISESLFELLAWSWGNRAYIVEVECLREIIARVQAAKGSILECGSGLSTLIAGALIDGSQTTLYALEHDRDWHARICGMVEEYKLRNVRPLYCPLKDFGEFSWYEVKAGDLPHDISLVLCDGPPGNTKGGRYGLLPVVGGQLAPEALILIDDYKRAEERKVVECWIGEFGGSLAVEGIRFPYALLTMPPRHA